MQDNSIYDNIKWYQWNYMQSKSCERIKPFTETLKKKKKKFGLFCWRKKNTNTTNKCFYYKGTANKRKICTSHNIT